MNISIIIPTYNYARYIARAIRSCIEQTFSKRDFEIIVVNDSSQDSTRHILASYGHWIRVIENETNKGLPYSRNQGILNAKGEMILNLDADDYIHPDFLRICNLYMDFNHCDAVGTDYFIVDDNENIVSRMKVHEKPIGCGILFRRQQMMDIGLYDPELKIGEDIDFRLRFEKKYKVERINLPLYRYRMHRDNLTSDAKLNNEYLSKVMEKNGMSVDHKYQREEFKGYK